ncbi:MAG: cohesin domain-containing protein, partial [bacterium]|nr:cohesin domain-containing protein [bacterium]
MAVEIIAPKKALIVLAGFIFAAVLGWGAGTEAATLYFSPSSGTYSTGRNFTVSVRVDSSQALNAVSGVVIFPASKLEVSSVSKTGSIFNLWVQEPSFSNVDSLGNVRFEGIVLNPGFTGDGKLLSVTFRVKAAGEADLSFSSGSVLANDGLGTNILNNLDTANFVLSVGAISTPEEVATPSRLPPEPFIKHEVKNQDGEMILVRDSEAPEKWINSSFNKFIWTIPSGVTGVSVLLHDKPTANPGSKPDGFFDNKVYERLNDGIYIFHIRYQNDLGAGPILHYKFMVDATPPGLFQIILPDGEVTANPTPRIRFETTDNLSGIARYEVKIDDGNWFNAAQLKVSSYVLPKLGPGEHIILVRAYDKAENYAEASAKIIISAIAAPSITEYPTNIISPGQTLVIKGTATSKATVEIHMNKKGQAPIVFSARADDDGNFEADYENAIPSGAYEVWAKQILESGSESFPSVPVYIGVNSWFWRAFQWLKNVGGIMIIGLVLIAALVVAAYYFIHHFRMWRVKLRREVREAESAVERGFKKLKKEIKSGKTASKVMKDLSEIEK